MSGRSGLRRHSGVGGRRVAGWGSLADLRIGRPVIARFKEPFTSNRESTDDQDADQPDHDRHEDRHNLGHCSAADDDAGGKTAMIDNGNRDPTTSGMAFMPAANSQPPKTYQTFGRFVPALLGCEQAGNTGKVNPAECNRKDCRPTHSGKGQIAKHVLQGKLGCTIVENLECKQR